MIEKLAKQIKRNNKKRNLNITLATIVGFLLSSGIVYGETLNSPIDSDTKYTENKTLEMTGKQIIATKTNGSPSITIDAKGYTLELEHETGARGDGITILNGSTFASIAATTGDIKIEAEKLVLNSTFTSDYASYSMVASPKQGTSSTPKLTLNAKEIEIYATGTNQVYGIGTEKNGYVEILGNLKMNIEAVGGSYGLNAWGGNIKLKNKYTSVKIENIGGTANAAYGIIITDNGEINIESEKLTLDIFSNTTNANGIFAAVGKLNIKTEDIDIKTESTSFSWSVTSITAGEGSEVNIDNNKLLKIETISGGSARSVYTSGKDISGKNTKLTINSEDIIIKTDSTGTAKNYYSCGLYAIDSGKLEIISNNITINTNANGSPAYGLISDKGGEVEITSDKTVFNTTASSGQAIGISAANGGKVTINGGLEISQTGATNYSVISNSSGVVNLNQNNEAVDVKIKGEMQAKSGGTINLNLNGKDSYFIGRSYIDANASSKTNLGISNGAVWKNEGESKVSELNFDNGIIDMTHKTGRQEIVIDKMSGNHGKIIMDISSADTDQKNGKTDFISIENADTEQKHYIEVGENSIIDLANYDFSKDILIGKASDNIKFEGSKFESFSNVYDYTLELKDEAKGTAGNNWYITGIEKKESTVTEIITDDMSLHYMNTWLARMEADTLHKRLSDVRDSKEGAGVWSRVVSGQMETDKNGYSKNDYTMIQAGIDKSETSMSGTWITGIAVQRREGKTDFRNGDGKNESTGISLYKSWFGNENQYLDLVGKYSHIKNEYKSYNTKNEKMEADYHTNAGTLSIEYGKRVSKNKWYLQPHVQTTYTWIEGKNYMTSTDVRAEQKDINSLIGKAGIYAGYDFGRSSHFIKVGILHEFMGDYGVTIKGKDASITKDMNGKDTWIELGIGGDIKVGKTGSTNVYYGLEKTFGGDFETNWQASLGIRHKF
ncbi:autotransporter outer membrane beta-barrel domain-containing protein [Fusobacterium varium]|uniref:autotransporter outer membrane beta-barrel domain-containing protein n=1 Tax=Fusobacterium varium TaxID=856 RepID=UPI000E4174AC|nr:autotransporter outer membrane beta-barrel domain-containing protein [Fusobacterium varium]MCI6033152.1 autotransporter outer membrane beta-barrel domain-containing protein [Fusobacterium varium]RGJ22382.1 autotransporter outer membrane beta-barrel domain-containing protein [Fusobacterium varium]